MKRLPVAMITLALLAMVSCGIIDKAVPVPPGKQAFVGTWKSGSGFTLEILAAGTANITQNLKPADPDFDQLCIKVGPPVITGALVQFEGDALLRVFRPMVFAREYAIERPPHGEHGQTKIVLNGVVLVKQ